MIIKCKKEGTRLKRFSVSKQENVRIVDIQERRHSKLLKCKNEGLSVVQKCQKEGSGIAVMKVGRLWDCSDESRKVLGLQ